MYFWFLRLSVPINTLFRTSIPGTFCVLLVLKYVKKKKRCKKKLQFNQTSSGLYSAQKAL